MWVWTNFWHHHFAPDKSIVYINLDESSCKLWTTPYRGLLTASTHQKKKHRQEPRQHVSLARRRQAFSLIAVLANDSMFQNILPQFCIVNAHTLSIADTTWLERTQQDHNVFVHRRGSARLKAKDLANIIRQIGRVLAPWRRTHAFIFSLDACPTHWTDVVAHAAAESNLAIVLIPPLTTSILQPLDVHVFHHMKRAARYGLEQLQGEHPGEELRARDIIYMWSKTIRNTLNSQNWKRAFESCGFGGDDTHVGKRCREQTHLSETKYISTHLPTLEDLQRCSTSRSRLPIGWWFHLALKSHTMSKGAAMATTSAEPDVPHSICIPGVPSSSSTEPHRSGVETWMTTRAMSAASMQPPRVPRAVRLWPGTRQPHA